MNSTPIHDRIALELEKRRISGTFRHIAPYGQRDDRRGEPRRIDCSTNSYLGLHANIDVSREASHLADDRLCGNLASRLISGRSDLYHRLEAELSEWEGTESALVFTSGYTANVGIIQALCTRSTEVFCDRLNHASIYDGIRLAGCKLNRYRHVDMADLAARRKGTRAKEKLVITDTVFSMDGDRAPLGDIAELAKAYDAAVMVDEAHATGLFGSRGSGLVEATGTADAIAVRMGTLSKAIAGLGGYAAVPALLRDYFVNFSRSLVYSTGLPHAVLSHDLAAIRYIRKNPGIGAAVLKGADRLRQSLNELGFSTTPSTTQIVPCHIGSERTALALSAYLADRNVIVPAIRPPTVPRATARLRFSWSALRNDDDCNTIVNYLKTWKNGDK